MLTAKRSQILHKNRTNTDTPILFPSLSFSWFGTEPVESSSGTILAVCSCTVLPLFAGIYTRGPGIGPTAAFLYSGPAITLTAKILGPGCPECQLTEKVVKEAEAEAGVAADIEKVTDTMKIAGYGVFGTPAVVVDGEVKSVGKISKKEDVLGWIR
jgi:small redox-active disulfide protein 2